jgi:hypothetical protein
MDLNLGAGMRINRLQRFAAGVDMALDISVEVEGDGRVRMVG